MKHPTLGRNLNEVSLTELIASLPRMTRARAYRSIKADPTIQGFVYVQTLMLGVPFRDAVVPFGPNCTAKTWQDWEGVGVYSSETALTNPFWAQSYAFLPEGFPHSRLAELDALIATEEAAGLAELPRVWTGRKKNNGLRMNDRLRNPETGAELIVLTFGGKHMHSVDLNRVLICPVLAYSTETETDPTSPDYQYSKGH